MIKQKRQRVETLQAAETGRLPSLTWHQRLTRLLVRHKGIPIGGTLLVVVIGMALLASWLTHTDPTALNPRGRLMPPGQGPLFGTDNFGRDVFSRTVWGARLSYAGGGPRIPAGCAMDHAVPRTQPDGNGVSPQFLG